MTESGLPSQFKELERFVCLVYSSNGQSQLSSLRWEMFRSRNLEGELLPPTLSTLLPHIQRTNYICTRDKSYVSSKPTLPKLEENGWTIKDGIYEPVHCVSQPAPKAVLELAKCGCKKECSRNCSCVRNKLACTALCKCYAWSCNSYYGLYKTQEDTHLDDEDDLV